MSFIYGYLGKNEAFAQILKGLHQLSHGNFVRVGLGLCGLQFSIFRTDRSFDDLIQISSETALGAHCGIGKAYLEAPKHKFYGPKYSYDKQFQIVFDGAIENYSVLRRVLINKGIRLDTYGHGEALINFIKLLQEENRSSIEFAIRSALDEIRGHYSFMIISKEETDTIFAATKDSPLVIGRRGEEHFITSDEKLLEKYSDELIPIREDQIAIVSHDNFEIRDFDTFNLEKKYQNLNMRTETGDKLGFDHYMLKEIHAQRYVLRTYIKEYVSAEEGKIDFNFLTDNGEDLMNIKRILIIASGSSYYAGLVGEYILEQFGQVSVKVEYASEFRYKDFYINPNEDIVLFMSKSGEAPDTVACFDKVKKLGIQTFAICNNPNSSIGSECDVLIPTRITQEYGIASSNSFSSQYFMICLMALSLGKDKNNISDTDFRDLLFQLESLPDKMAKVLEKSHDIELFSKLHWKTNHISFFGRSSNYAVAREASHLMRKIATVHSESYPAAELKDGPIGLIDEGMPAVVIANSRKSYKKVLSNIKEIIERKGKVLAIIREDDSMMKSILNHYVEIPMINDLFSPFLTVLVVQLLVYYAALARNQKVDVTEIIEEETYQ